MRGTKSLRCLVSGFLVSENVMRSRDFVHMSQTSRFILFDRYRSHIDDFEDLLRGSPPISKFDGKVRYPTFLNKRGTSTFESFQIF